MVGPKTRKVGTSLLEALLGLLLMGLVVQGAWTVLAQHRKAGLAIGLRVDGLETVRTAAWILSQEVGQGRPEVDWRVPSGDSLTLRAFRGLGMVDPDSTSASSLLVCFRGLRSPEPEKDSVLVMGNDGGWRAYDLVSRTRLSRECLGQGKGRQERWRLFPQPSSAVLARLFESGTYYLTDRALRYRRGLGGRQPLTPEVVESGRFFGPEEGGDPFSWEILLRDRPREEERPAPEEVRHWRGSGE